jgi:hypothetical protein
VWPTEDWGESALKVNSIFFFSRRYSGARIQSAINLPEEQSEKGILETYPYRRGEIIFFYPGVVLILTVEYWEILAGEMRCRCLRMTPKKRYGG